MEKNIALNFDPETNDWRTTWAATGMLTNESHYFVSTGAEWWTGPNLVQLLIKARASGRSRQSAPMWADVYFVPLPPSAHYKIESYKPAVPGLIDIGRFTL